VAATEEEKFDPRSIPRKTWSEYEQELWEVGSQRSHESRATMRTHQSRVSFHSQRSHAASVYAGTVCASGSEYGMLADGVPSLGMVMPTTSSVYGGSVIMSGPNLYPTAIPGALPGGIPSDEDILNEIRRILSEADLMQVTKKQVRDELATVFGVDMEARKDYINQCIELML
ncbi:DEK C terminal domain-containing protein, partial [Thamnocephalis sphaerospora]